MADIRIPPMKGDKYDGVVVAIREVAAAVEAYKADRCGWLPWRSLHHRRRVEAARRGLLAARARAGMRQL